MNITFSEGGNFINVRYNKIKVGEVCFTASEVVINHSEVFVLLDKSEVFPLCGKVTSIVTQIPYHHKIITEQPKRVAVNIGGYNNELPLQYF